MQAIKHGLITSLSFEVMTHACSGLAHQTRQLEGKHLTLEQDYEQLKRAANVKVDRVQNELKDVKNKNATLKTERQALLLARDQAQEGKEQAERRANELTQNLIFRDSKINELNKEKVALETSLILERGNMVLANEQVKKLTEELAVLKDEKQRMQEDLENNFYYTWLVCFRCARHIDPGFDWSKMDEALEAGIGEISQPGEVLPPSLADFFALNRDDQVTEHAETVETENMQEDRGIELTFPGDTPGLDDLVLAINMGNDFVTGDANDPVNLQGDTPMTDVTSPVPANINLPTAQSTNQDVPDTEKTTE